MKRPTLLLLVTEDWYVVSHRLPLVRAAVSAGFHVVLACRVQDHGQELRATGAEVIPLLKLRREGRSPLGELAALWELIRLYRRVRPDVAHHVAMKPVLYGTLAAHASSTPRVVNALAGLGYAFTGQGRGTMRALLASAFRWLFRRSGVVVLVQNRDDAEKVVEVGVPARKIRIIRGAGVELDRYVPVPPPGGTPIVAVVARMLADKGIREFVTAARSLKAEDCSARFVLVGGEDHANPAHIPRDELRTWVGEGVVEWWGHRTDMPAVLSQSTIVCLPSHREGLPKALLEAAASARPIVATDVPGCREVVHHGVNGLLVPSHDAVALAAAIRQLLDDSDLRIRMGAEGRRLVEADFSAEAVAEQTLALYREPQ